MKANKEQLHLNVMQMILNGLNANKIFAEHGIVVTTKAVKNTRIKPHLEISLSNPLFHILSKKSCKYNAALQLQLSLVNFDETLIAALDLVLVNIFACRFQMNKIDSSLEGMFLWQARPIKD